MEITSDKIIQKYLVQQVADQQRHQHLIEQLTREVGQLSRSVDMLSRAIEHLK